MRTFIRSILTTFIFLTFSGVASANQEVDVELVFLADASGSIDDAEIKFQRRGYAEAIVHPRCGSVPLPRGFCKKLP